MSEKTSQEKSASQTQTPKDQGHEAVVLKAAPLQPKKEFVKVAAPQNMNLLEAAEAGKNVDVVRGVDKTAKQVIRPASPSTKKD